MGAAKFVIFFNSLTTSLFSLSVSRTSGSLNLLDFLYVLALGNELLGKVVSWVVFADDEEAEQKFSDTFQRENEEEKPISHLLTVSLRTCRQSIDMSLAGIEQLQEIVADFDSADMFDDEWFIQQLRAETLL